MIQLYALLYFNLLLRQNTTAPPQTANEWIYFAIITVLSVLLGGGVLAAWLKNWTDDQALKNEQARGELSIKLKEAQADIAAKQQAQTAAVTNENAMADQSKALTDIAMRQLELYSRQAGTLTDIGTLFKQNTDILDALQAAIAAERTELSEGRAKIVSEVNTKVMEANKNVDEHREESKNWVDGLHKDIGALRIEFTEGVDKILDQLALMPTSAKHDAALKQFIEMVDALGKKFEAIEARLPAAPESPKADGPALAADGKPEVKPPSESVQ